MRYLEFSTSPIATINLLIFDQTLNSKNFMTIKFEGIFLSLLLDCLPCTTLKAVIVIFCVSLMS